ncbi:hypothetical protein BGY98DRAFT_1010447 [Russula aff. rugulosa BPL654]|nr:hypothetical protein BGY98DRAFT_1010447 [Russula aff. rugulosa BPL654]
MVRGPTEMSRPATTNRAGFHRVSRRRRTHSNLGRPIRGILSFTSMSTDEAGRFIPAPGRSALSIAREVQSKHRPPVLEIVYRARQPEQLKKGTGSPLKRDCPHRSTRLASS